MNEHQTRQYQKKTLMMVMITTTFRTKEIPAFGDPGRHTLYTYISPPATPVRFPPLVARDHQRTHRGMQVKKIINGDASPLVPAGRTRRSFPVGFDHDLSRAHALKAHSPEGSEARFHWRPSEVAARRQGFRLSLRRAPNNNQASRFDTPKRLTHPRLRA